MTARFEIVGKSVLIGGCGRSGTTILGKLIGSLEGIEYYFEPAFLHKFIYEINNIPHDRWQSIFEWYIYDDLLLNSLAGRNLNWNLNDDSCVLNFKSDTVKQRLSTSHRKLDLEAQAANSRVAFKIPDLVFQMPLIRSIYPEISSVSIFRKPEFTIPSIHQKLWFHDQALDINSPMPQIAFSVHGNSRVPLWVPEEEVGYWLSLPEIDRAAYYYIKANEILLSQCSQLCLICYDSLINNAETEVNKICNYLKTEFSSKTKDVINSIRTNERDAPSSWNEINADLRSKARNLYDQLYAKL